jgi:hypothetical protein
MTERLRHVLTEPWRSTQNNHASTLLTQTVAFCKDGCGKPWGLYAPVLVALDEMTAQGSIRKV